MTAPLDLEELRRKIDAVDKEILKQLRERVGLVMLVGEYKRERNIPVYDPKRERDLLERLSNAAEHPLDREFVHNVFERLVDESRRIEQHHID
ncbi:MAG TPA: chorismate mutase [Polyangiaceae bacterium]|nr:chorismate mutase [Polyangiaceae bacterium]